MSVAEFFAYAFLLVWHGLQSCFILFKSLLPRPTPLALADSRRKQVPRHVALVLHAGDAQDEAVISDMIDCTRQMIRWCSRAGIDMLTLYDEKGILKANSDTIIDSLPTSTHTIRVTHPPPQAASSIPPHVQYPLTPPSSDAETASSGSSSSSATSTSPPIHFSVPCEPMSVDDTPSASSTTDLRRRRTRTGLQTPEPPADPLMVNIICRDQGKPALARAARQLAFQQHTSTSEAPIAVRIEDIDAILRDEMSEPDLLIVHTLLYPRKRASFLSRLVPNITLPKPVELYGFPPWQVRLSEIHYDPLPPSRFFSLLFASRPSSPPPAPSRKSGVIPASPSVITEFEFRRSLDAFGNAEMRVGK
ncbi:hypothetical protein FRB96_001022 [Tulasnella sp. 330]|nr:hypothetical protein FRB96_001022 [Tulasnella sp. 330]KAG8873828.1 hypothetical protein FRB97_006432 [Tulasnella sp. 331]